MVKDAEPTRDTSVIDQLIQQAQDEVIRKGPIDTANVRLLGLLTGVDYPYLVVLLYIGSRPGNYSMEELARFVEREIDGDVFANFQIPQLLEKSKRVATQNHKPLFQLIENFDEPAFIRMMTKRNPDLSIQSARFISHNGMNLG